MGEQERNTDDIQKLSKEPLAAIEQAAHQLMSEGELDTDRGAGFARTFGDLLYRGRGVAPSDLDPGDPYRQAYSRVVVECGMLGGYNTTNLEKLRAMVCKKGDLDVLDASDLTLPEFVKILDGEQPDPPKPTASTAGQDDNAWLSVGSLLEKFEVPESKKKHSRRGLNASAVAISKNGKKWRIPPEQTAISLSRRCRQAHLA